MRDRAPLDLNKDSLLPRIRQVLSTRERNTCAMDGLHAAAVLVPLGWHNNDEPYVILTKRSMQVETHKGEISFPGGHCEPADPTPEATALRESQEEIGLEPSVVKILGRLNDHVTIFHYHITPVVGAIPYPYPFTINDEADSVITLSLRQVLSDEAWMTGRHALKGLSYDIYCIAADGGFVWGVTGRMLKHFAELILGREIIPGPISPDAQNWIDGVVAAQQRYTRA